MPDNRSTGAVASDVAHKAFITRLFDRFHRAWNGRKPATRCALVLLSLTFLMLVVAGGLLSRLPVANRPASAPGALSIATPTALAVAGTAQAATTLSPSPTPVTNTLPGASVGGETQGSAPATPTGHDIAGVATSSLLPLAGHRIALDPGHGPRGDMGAVLVDPNTGALLLSEAEFNLDVAKRCRDLLVARGAGVVLTRETMDTFTAPWPVDANGDGLVGAPGDDLQERVDIINNFHADVFMSIHANGGTADPPAFQDIQALYCGTSDCPFPAQSKQLGKLVLDALQSKLDSLGYQVPAGLLSTDLDADTSVPPQHLFLLGPLDPPRHVRATWMPGVLAESLYVTSPWQAVALNKFSVRQAIALAYADALQMYLTGSEGK